MGADKWRYESEWPLARTRFTKFYLHSSDRANSAKGDGKLKPSPPTTNSPTDEFVYDPENPVYTLGGQISTHAEVREAQNRSSVQEREDILVSAVIPE